MGRPICRLSGANGNIFNLIGIASATLKWYGMAEEAYEMETRIWEGEADSYEEALRIIMEYVEVE